MQVLRVGLVSVLCAACFNPSGAGSSTGSGETTQAATGEVPTTTDGPTGGTGSGTAAATTEPGGTSGGSTGEGSTSGGETVEPAVCGNGKVEMGEVCDDGNMIEDDGCLADCTTLCGDGDLDEGEACDDGDRIDGDGCSATCRRDAAYVFVTRDAVPAMLGGIGGADTVCHDAAVAGGLPGTYRAWLGEGGAPVAEHVAAQSLAYVRPDGALVAVDFASFVTDAPGEVLAAPIAVTEYGEAIAAEEGCGAVNLVWTGLAATGEGVAGKTCADWTIPVPGDIAEVGDLDERTTRWTTGCPLPCDQMARLYCFEVPA